MSGDITVSVGGGRLAGPLTGVSRYCRSVLRCWSHERPVGVDRIIVHSPRPISGADEFRAPWIVNANERSPLPPLVWENTVLPRRMRASGAHFAPSFTMPVRGHVPPTVLAVHDALQALRPGDFGRRGRYVALPLMRKSIGRAEILVTVSDAAKADIVDGFGVDPHRLHVVRGGVDDRFRRRPDFDIEKTQHRLEIGAAPYLLFVGKMSVRRNITGLIAAAGLLRKRGFPHWLVLAGHNTNKLPLDELARASNARIRYVEDIDDDGLVDLYNGADVFVQAPFHETYSLPLVEAMACGTPTITSGQPALREIGGTAPIFLDETTPLAIADALESLLNDPGRRAAASTAGLERARSFGWTSQATTIASLLVEASRLR